ncbi:hypothetical protein TSAR_009806 [Trichomalopsis sarcophagae]|uniref:Uncharacterized protein n=1 Tax=Trichomalopsis sarcophagae TaxID=543379 RepID=A0A232FEQ0_9HYME|nr:hypothetical protein TSAR_009806 [Trichomalopsis sarcophagae]
MVHPFFSIASSKCISSELYVSHRCVCSRTYLRKRIYVRMIQVHRCEKQQCSLGRDECDDGRTDGQVLACAFNHNGARHIQ